MQQRSIFYTLEQILSGDLLGAQVYGVIGDGNALQVLLGKTQTVISNLVVTPTSPASLTLNISNGFIGQLEQVDQSTYGSLPADTQQIMQLGYNLVQSVLIDNAGLSVDQAQYVMIEAGFQEQDSNSTVLPYVNISDPAVPLNGPGNSGIAQDTVRNAVCNIQVKYGTPATAGYETVPTPDAGYVPVALIDLAYGQVSITVGEILNPNDVEGSAASPILAGLLNSHHSGVVGQAPQIQLGTSGPGPQEVQGELPMANLFASNIIGAVSAMRQGSGNPNGVLAGNSNTNGVPDSYYDYTNNLLWVCTTTGDASLAVWTAINVSTPLPVNIIYFGGNANSTWNRPAPTSGTLTGDYYTPTNWTQTGSLTLNSCRLYFGGGATFNTDITITPELSGGTSQDSSEYAGSSAGTGLGGGGAGENQGAGAAAGGGGGGFGGTGGNGGSTNNYPGGGPGGGTYPISTSLSGSGGGGAANNTSGGPDGASGGGSLYIEADGPITFTSSAYLTANGDDAENTSTNSVSGAGAGSGGGIQIRCLNAVTIDTGAVITANGGNGGSATGSASPDDVAGGGGGGGGVVDISGNIDSVNNGTIAVNGGRGGTGTTIDGYDGSIGVVNFNTFVLGRRSAG